MKTTIVVPKFYDKLVILMQASYCKVHEVEVKTSREENLHFREIGHEMMVKMYKYVQKYLNEKYKLIKKIKEQLTWIEELSMYFFNICSKRKLMRKKPSQPRWKQQHKTLF
jgi:hypothetical protein